MIIEDAKQIAAHLQLPTQQFRFSKGWVWGFQQRYRIKSLPDHDEAGSCDRDQVVQGQLECQEVIAAYDKCDVYNLDETALNYCAHPTKSLRRRGTKLGKFGCFCTNFAL